MVEVMLMPPVALVYRIWETYFFLPISFPQRLVVGLLRHTIGHDAKE
jgi:hypothetical protein